VIGQRQSLLQQLVSEWSDKLVVTHPVSNVATHDPVKWIEKNFLIERPRDPLTAAMLPKGPIRLADYQKRVIKEALSRNPDGTLKYSTILWSEPKKSGKTAIAAAVGMYMATTHDTGMIYCLANDGKQSKDRIFTSMAQCIRLHTKLGGDLADTAKVAYSRAKIILDNGSQIEAVPCDAAGEAGAEPLMTIWSEMWGYAQKHKARIWSEMTIPPTLYGYALRWVESYAGYEGESTVLWNLYDKGVNQGRRHPNFMDLPVYVNDAARQFTLWSHTPMQPWQTQGYYNAEAEMLTPNEFRRIHKNQWVTSTTSLFDDMILWDRCHDSQIARSLPPGDMTPMIIALDAGYASDCAAIYGVTRHPDDEWDAEVRRVVERYAVAFKPEKGKKLNFSNTMVPAIERLCDNYNIYNVVYDPYQLHKMCTDMKLQGTAPFTEFSQAGRRLRADRQLYDMIIHRQFIHSGDDDVGQHVANCAKKEEGKHMRFVKISASRPIDLIVAASMAVDECLRLNI